MEKTTRRKRIPYGMMNFIDVREDNCYYVDKTRFIPMIEDANKYFFYIRPRRFGKSYNPQIEMFARFKMKSSFHKTKRII